MSGVRQYDRMRGTAASRGYDRQWRAFRVQYLSRPENVMCRDCKKVVATDIHHRIKLGEHPDLKYVDTNLLPLCDECHNTRTARGE
jgi:5-methylcytosine-specific restriction protein A